MKVAVIGSGYVGLVTGTCLAETGNQVWCVDNNSAKVALMKKGEVPIYEPHLETFFSRNIKAERLKFTENLELAVKESDVIFLCLPTPPEENGSADLFHVLEVAEKIGGVINSYKVVVNKSTVPVGTYKKVAEKISISASQKFDVVSNPEFLREGFAVEDFMKPSRVIIGSDSQRAISIMQNLYKPYTRSGNPIIVMDPRSAEITKYAANAFLAAKISFMNEIANFCEKSGADVEKVRLGMGSDDRIGKKFLFAGIGYGGSCFPKDVIALDRSGIKYGYDFRLLKSIMQVNREQKKVLFSKIDTYFQNQLHGKKITLWGLAFKPDTDDIREAPAIELIKQLKEKGVILQVFDPEAIENTKKIFNDEIQYFDKQYEALRDTDALVICTEWHQFRNPDFKTIVNYLKKPTVIFDGRNLYDPKKMKTLHINYFCIGRKSEYINP